MFYIFSLLTSISGVIDVGVNDNVGRGNNIPYGETKGFNAEKLLICFIIVSVCVFIISTVSYIIYKKIINNKQEDKKEE